MKPKQRLSEAEKNRAWRRDTLKYWSEMKMNHFLQENDIKFLKLAAGQLEATDYTYLTNPFGMKDDRYKAYPAKLRNFDFISPLFLRWISEYNQRVFEPIVYTKNSNFDNEKLEYERKLIEQSLQQQFINGLIQSGLFDPNQMDEQGNPVQPPMSSEVIAQKTSSLPDLKTIAGQHAIDYIKDKQELTLKYRKAFEYFIKINKCVTFKDVRRDEVILKVVSPLDVNYYGNRNITFLQDADAIVVDYYNTFEEVLEIFEDLFTDYTEEYGDIVTQLENEMTNRSSGGDRTPNYFSDIFVKNAGGRIQENRDISDNGLCSIKHICWTSYRKVKKVIGDDGEILELTEDYQGDDVIEETWYPEEREGWLVHNKYFIGGYATDIQIVDSDNPYSTKKNYNGRIFMQGDVTQLTCPERLFLYQEAYNATQWKMQSAINKDKGKFVTMPIGLMQGLKDTGTSGTMKYTGDTNPDGSPKYALEGHINTTGESAIAKNMYFTDATGVMFLDETAENFAVGVQAIKAVDLSLGNWIEFLANRLANIKAEAENLLGFNSARTGGIKASETVTNASNNIYSGSLITEEYFTEFEEFMTTELQGLLDRSKYAFRVGKKANYIRSNTDIAVLQIDEGFAESSYGVFIRSTAKTKEVLDNLKAQATQFLQNSPKGGSTVAKLFSGTTNYASIIQDLEENEDLIMNTEQQNQEADRQNQMQIAQITEQSKQADRDLKKYEIDTRAQTEIAKVGAGFNLGKEGGEEIAGNLISETNDLIDKLQKNQLKAQEIQSKERMTTQSNKTKLQVADKSLQVAKTNK